MPFSVFTAQRDALSLNTVHIEWAYSGAATEYALTVNGETFPLLASETSVDVSVSRWLNAELTLVEVNSGESIGPIMVPANPPALTPPTMTATRNEAGEAALTLILPAFITRPNE